MMMTDVGISISIAVIALGLLFFWRLSWYGSDVIHPNIWHKIQNDFRLALSFRRPFRDAYHLDTFGTFFLGGKRVGGELTGQTYWSLCFAFANAIWYFAYLAYTYGPWTFLLQIPWTVAVIVLSRYVFQYIAASKSGTVHGFINRSYGAPTAVLAAVATCIGYVLNCGFEIFYSVHLLALALGFKAVELVVAFGLAFFITACIVAGGYSANVRTDFWKNAFGVIGVVLLLAWLFPAYAATFPTVSAAFTEPWTSATLNAIPPWHFIVGIVVFAFFFNFVDMANWQALAANQEDAADELSRVKRDLLWSALKQLFAPALLGACLGIMLRVLRQNTVDEDYFRVAFEIGFPFSSLTVLGGLAFGFVLLGLISAAISSVDNYLLAAMQTIAVDIFKRGQVAALQDPSLAPEVRRDRERKLIYWCKRYMPLLAGLMVLVFASLFYAAKEKVFAYQFVMYGAAVTLFPALIGAFRAAARDTQARISGLKPLPAIHSSWAFFSILLGLCMVIGPFSLSTELHALLRSRVPFELAEDAIPNLTPLAGLVTAAVVYWMGAAHRRWRMKR